MPMLWVNPAPCYETSSYVARVAAFRFLCSFITRPDGDACRETWRFRGGNVGGWVQTIRVQVYWRLFVILAAGLRFSPRRLGGGDRAPAPDRDTGWVRTASREGVLSEPKKVTAAPLGWQYSRPQWMGVQLLSQSQGLFLECNCNLVFCNFLTNIW